MAFLVCCIEVPREDREKAEAVMLKYIDNGDINTKYSEYSSLNGLKTIQYWFTCRRNETSDILAKELEENGIKLF